VDAGEIGAGTSVTALYEITPTGSPAQLSDPLRYQVEVAAGTTTELGYLKLRLKAPGATASTLIDTPIRPETAAASDDVRFAAAIAGFGQLLTASPYLNGWTYADAIALAGSAKGDDPYGYRAEAVTLMRLAETLAQ
jgi:Ca-activated chloride channel homolog